VDVDVVEVIDSRRRRTHAGMSPWPLGLRTNYILQSVVSLSDSESSTFVIQSIHKILESVPDMLCVKVIKSINRIKRKSCRRVSNVCKMVYWRISRDDSGLPLIPDGFVGNQQIKLWASVHSLV
jgi:hypothetical protein